MRCNKDNQRAFSTDEGGKRHSNLCKACACHKEGRGRLGLSYLKDIKGPINHVKFLAAAGVNEENFKEYLNAGYCAAGISGRFIDRKVIAEGNFEELTRRARIFTDIANAC